MLKLCPLKAAIFVWRSGSSDTIWLGLIWFSGFKGEDLNVIFYQNMSNLHNRYKSEFNIYFFVKFFFQPIIQIRHILIKDHI
jgi:hypothetical protein